MRAAAFKRSKTDAGSGHGLIRKFVVSCVEVETSKVDSRGPDPLHPRSVRYFCFDYGALNCVQEREMEDSRRILCGFCSSGSLKDPHLRRPTEIARTPGGVLYAKRDCRSDQ